MPPGSHEYYKTLGVPRTASPDQIRRAHRKLARRYHPDFNPGDKSAEERFKNIQEAYDVLIDSNARRRYDETAFKSRPAPVPTPAAAPASARPHPATNVGPSVRRRRMPAGARRVSLADLYVRHSEGKLWEISEGLAVILFASFLVATASARAGLAEESLASLGWGGLRVFEPVAILPAIGFLLSGSRGNLLVRCALINAAAWCGLMLYCSNAQLVRWPAIMQLLPWVLATHLPVMLGAYFRRGIAG
jgi:hypothetical protein